MSHSPARAPPAHLGPNPSAVPHPVRRTHQPSQPPKNQRINGPSHKPLKTKQHRTPNPDPPKRQASPAEPSNHKINGPALKSFKTNKNHTPLSRPALPTQNQRTLPQAIENKQLNQLSNLRHMPQNMRRQHQQRLRPIHFPHR